MKSNILLELNGQLYIYIHIYINYQCQLYVNIPSGKLTVRPWQSSGLVQIRFHYTTRLYFQGQQVNLPEGSNIH